MLVRQIGVECRSFPRLRFLFLRRSASGARWTLSDGKHMNIGTFRVFVGGVESSFRHEAEEIGQLWLAKNGDGFQ